MTSSVGRTPLVWTTRGSETTTASTVAEALWPARLGTRPASRTLELAAVATRHNAVPRRANATAVTQDRRRHRRCRNTRPRPANPAADRARTTGRRDSMAATAIHPSRAGTSSRTSIPGRSPASWPGARPVPDEGVPDERASGGGAAISDGDLGPDLRQELVPDTTDLTKLVDGGEPAMSGTPVQNPLREDGAHSGQRVQCGRVGGVEVHQRTRRTTRGALTSRPCSGSLTARCPNDNLPWFGHHDLLAVGENTGEVHLVEVGRRLRPARRVDCVENPGAGRQTDDARTTYLPHDMDQQHAGRRGGGGRRPTGSCRGERRGDGPGDQPAGRAVRCGCDRLGPGCGASPDNPNTENHRDGDQKDQDPEHRKATGSGAYPAQGNRNCQDRRLRRTRTSVAAVVRECLREPCGGRPRQRRPG